MSWKNFACVLLASTLVFGAVGCGSQSGIGGFGSFTLTSVAPNPVPGMIPTPVTITGGDFSNIIGTTVEVKWCAPAGTIPFLGGTSDETTSVGTITSATTIDTVSPRAVICGPVSLDIVLKVTLPSGVWGSSVVPIVTMLAPTMTSISGGGIFPAAIPTPFTITGTGYGDIGSPVTIHWRSTDGVVPTPFKAGSSATIETQGLVTSATTITGTSPLALVCGPVSSSAEIYKIYFQDGSCTPDTNPPLGVTFVAPTVTLVTNNTARPLDAGSTRFAAAIQEPFTLTGTGYGPIGGTATVTVTAAANSIFSNGASTSTTVSGTIQSPTSITVPESAFAFMCNNPAGITTEPVVFDVLLPDGSCTPTGAGTAGTYNAPVITSIVNSEVGGALNGTNDFDAARPVDFTITGTRFGRAGDLAQVTFTSTTAAPGDTPFSGGTAAADTVNASVVSSTTITGVSPMALVCTIASIAADTIVTSPGGSCTPVPVVADFLAPTVTAVTNTSTVGPHAGTTAPADFAAAVPEPFLITGTGFGPIGGTAFVLFQNNAGGFVTPYEAGTSETIVVPGQITSPTTIVGVSPEGAFCSTTGIVAAGGSMTVTMPDGACTLDSGFTYVMNPPTVTAIANLDRGGGVFLSAIPETFEITGTDFGPVGGTATITFSSSAVGLTIPGTPFAGGTSRTVDVLATITSRTTIEGVSPEALLCPDPVVAGDPATGVTADMELLATLEGGACNTTDAGVPEFGFDALALFAGPTLTTADLLITVLPPPATGTAGGPPLDVPSTVLLTQDDPENFRINGTGFAPLGSIALITFEDITAPLTAFNGAATVTVPAIVIDENTIEGALPTITTPRLLADEVVRVTVTLAPNGSCAYDDALFQFMAPPTHDLPVAAGGPLVPPTPYNTDNSTATGFVAGNAFGTQLFYPCMNSRIIMGGSGFLGTAPAGPLTTAVTIYDTNGGVDPITKVPVRVLGTATPAGDDVGDPTTIGFTDTPALDTIAGRIRGDSALAALDTDNDGRVSVTIRLTNPDLQFHEITVNDWLTQTPAINVGASGNNRNNNDVAIDPTSFTDDFASAAGSNDGVPGVNITAVSGDDPGGGILAFSGIDSWTATSLDGGVTFTQAAGGLPGLDGAGVGPFVYRNFHQVEYDRFGNQIQMYLLDDFVGGASTIHVVLNGALLGGVSPYSNGPGLVGTIGQPSMGVGPDFPTFGREKALIAWTDSSGIADVVDCREWLFGGFGFFSGVSALATINDAPPAGTNFGETQAAVGPGGESYVAWEDQFIGPIFGPFSHAIRFDADKDGIVFITFGFGTDVTVATEAIPGFTLPAAPDTGPFIPLLDMAVAQTGTNSGRIVLTNENVVEADFVTVFVDHAQIHTRYSDDNGATWSSPAVPHAVDNADRFIPALCSDPTDGRFYITWYDTISSITTGNTTFERYAASSANGATWGASLNLSGARGASAQALDADTDFGVFAGVDAHNGCVVATWSDLVDSATPDPVVVMYQQR